MEGQKNNRGFSSLKAANDVESKEKNRGFGRLIPHNPLEESSARLQQLRKPQSALVYGRWDHLVCTNDENEDEENGHYYDDSYWGLDSWDDEKEDNEDQTEEDAVANLGKLHLAESEQNKQTTTCDAQRGWADPSVPVRRGERYTGVLHQGALRNLADAATDLLP